MRKKFVALLAAVGLIAGGALAGSAPATAFPPKPLGVEHSFGKVPAFPKIDPSRDKVVPTTDPAINVNSRTKGMARPVPPVTGVQIQKRSACSPPCYLYAGRARITSNVSAVAVNSSIITSSLDQQDYHSLWELTAQANAGAGSTCNILELGDNRDRVVNGDTYPALTTHLFGGAWYCAAGADGTVGTADDVATFCGYNSGCGYTDYGANSTNLGSDITAANNVRKTFQILHDDTQHVWWLTYDGGYLGYYPDNLGHGQSFTRSTLSQTFDEIAAAHNPTCTDMGNSWLADSTKTFPQTGQEVFSYNDDSATTGTLALAAYTNTTISLAAKWNVSTISNYSYYSGGPGYSPNPGACP